MPIWQEWFPHFDLFYMNAEIPQEESAKSSKPSHAKGDLVDPSREYLSARTHESGSTCRMA
jgi:hypothetical protein